MGCTDKQAMLELLPTFLVLKLLKLFHKYDICFLITRMVPKLALCRPHVWLKNTFYQKNKSLLTSQFIKNEKRRKATWNLWGYLLPRMNKRRILRHVKSGQVMLTPFYPFVCSCNCYNLLVFTLLQVMQHPTESLMYLNKLMSFVSSNKIHVLCLFLD